MCGCVSFSVEEGLCGCVCLFVERVGMWVCGCVFLCGRGLCVWVCVSLCGSGLCVDVFLCVGRDVSLGGSVGVGISLEGRVCVGGCVFLFVGSVSLGGGGPCVSVRASVCRSACLCPCVCFQWAECTEHSPFCSSRTFLSPQKDTPHPLRMRSLVPLSPAPDNPVFMI